MASVKPPRQLANGQKRYDVVWYPTGSSKQKTKTFPTKARANDFKTSVEYEMARGTYIDPDAGKVLLSDYIEQWLKDRTDIVGSTTLAQNTIRMRVHVTPVLGHLHLNRIDTPALRKWRGTLTHHSQAYQNAINTDFKAVLNMAVEDGLILKNPLKARTLRPVKSDPPKAKAWPKKWVHGVIDEIDQRYRVAPVIGAGLGLRQGEAFGLAVDDVNWLANTVTIRRQVKIVNSKLVFGPPKGGKTRTVPLPESVKVELNKHLAEYGSCEVTLPWDERGNKKPRMEAANLFLTTREETACNRNYWNGHVWRPALQRSCIPTRREDKNTFHALRHTFVSVLLDAGESIRTISDYVGHAKTSTTLDQYAHMMPAAEGRTRTAIDAALSAPDISASEMPVRYEPSQEA